MLLNLKIDLLQEEYCKRRLVQFSKNQFIYVVNLFPALLVTLSDNIVDWKEWSTVKKLTEMLGNELTTEGLRGKEENLSLIYKSEFRYLLNNRKEWEQKFIEALKEYLAYNPSSIKFVKDTMRLFAKASSGVSKAENETIIRLTKELGLVEK